MQAMIGMAIMGIAAAGFMTFLNTAQKGQKNVQNAVDFDMFKTSLNLVFNTKACDNSLIGAGGTPLTIAWSSPPVLGANLIVAGSPLPIFKIKYGSSILAEISKSIPYNSTGGMTLSKFEVVEAIYDGEQSIGSDTYKAFSSLIEIEATKAVGSFGAQKFTTKIGIRLLANTAPGVVGQVQKCGANNSTAQWVKLSSVVSPSAGADFTSFSPCLIFNNPVGNYSPDQNCRDAGFSYASGACRDNVFAPPFFGTLVSNRALGKWSTCCMYGNGAYAFRATTEILCMQ